MRASTAGMEDAPGSDSPSASIADAIVFAVYSAAHEPGPGQATRSRAMRSSREVVPAENSP